jgi:hypothetical protein
MKNLNEKFLPSLNQENMIHEELFSVPFVKGVSFSSSAKIDEETTTTYEFFLQPLTITLFQKEDGTAGQRRNQTTAAKLTYLKSNENGKIIFSLGSSPFLFINLTPVEQVPFSVQLGLGNKRIRPVFTTSFKSKYFHPTVRATLFSQPLISAEGNKFKFFDPTMIESLDFTFMVGTNNLSGGLQLVKRFNRNDRSASRNAFSALIQRKWDKNMAEVAIVKDPIATFVWRYQRKINDAWKIGATFSVSSMMVSNAQIAYKAEIGKSTIQGLVAANRVVQSSFTRKISDTFKFSVHSLLDHSEKNYCLGMSFAYDN